MSFDAPVVGVHAEGPNIIVDFEDLSGEGPGGEIFTYQKLENLLLVKKESVNKIRAPEPGEPGFTYIEQKNLEPQESIDKKRKNK